MLKIFDPSTTKWDSKVNFVDDANTVVGYDLSQQCCENAYYCFSLDPNAFTDVKTLDQEIMDKLIFDITYFFEGSTVNEEFYATFKLLGDAQPWYLILINAHNGYYGHGFTVEINGIKTKDGCL